MKYKIAFVCIYSKGGCGVWTSVKNIAKGLVKKGYEAHVFSTNNIKGSKEKAPSYEKENGIHIHRFSPSFSFGRNINFWSFEKELKKINPDIIIAEVYRHPHTHSALKIAKKLKRPIFLVTHAPFVEKDRRTAFGNLIEGLYDNFIGKKTLNSFDEVINITHWEKEYLKKLNLKKQLNYIPNGIPDDFFKNKIEFRTPEQITFLGRVSPVKNLETLIKAFNLLKKENKKVKLKILGSAEEEYKTKLERLARELNLEIDFSFLTYDLDLQLKELKEADIFVLPSKREAMPQSLIEAMAFGKVVIASKTQGAKEIIKDGYNGLLFEIDDEHDLKNKIEFCLDKKNSSKIKQIQLNARKSVEKFRLDNLVDKFDSLIKKHLK